MLLFLLHLPFILRAQVEEVWARRYHNSTAGGEEQAKAMAVDAGGNVYVTGYSEVVGGNRDYVTVKYNALGTQQWVSRYNGPGNHNDEPNAIAVDGSGNVYVTGTSWGMASSGFDYATVKYDASGTQLWVSRYNGPLGNGEDAARAIALDGSGNVYVTGSSEAVGGNRDYATIKYDASGTQQWVSRYNGPTSGDDTAGAITVDNSGNVYVTGYSWENGAYDYATLKYSAAGTQLWVRRYNGPLGNENDQARAIAIDNSGNVYVTGYSYGSGTNYDYATLKYSAAGAQLWVSRYNGPLGNGEDAARAIALDGSGNVYVTGNSEAVGGNRDYATVKYNSFGTQLWVSRYDGPASSSDDAGAIALDNTGNVYVTGNSVGSGVDSDYATVKYDASGTQLWVSRYDGPASGSDNALPIALDGGGNVYVTGNSVGSGVDSDFATVKYDASGTQLWVSRYNGPTTSEEQARSMAVDAGGNVYVTGYSVGSGTNHDYATVKYDAAGNELWVRHYNGPSNGQDQAETIAVDGSGNVYVTGTSWDASTSYDYTTIKYDASGTQLWVSRYNGPTSNNNDDRGRVIAIDGSGNVYVTGYSWGGFTNWDYATVKYNASGTQLWVSRYNSPASDQARTMAVDNSGNVYVTGTSQGPDTGTDYATIKYNTSGTQLWVSRYNGPANSTDDPNAIAVDNNDNVYITGNSFGSTTNSDYATVKYDASGTQLWASRYNGPASGDDQARTMAVDNSGNVYVTGYSVGSGTNYDYATVKYNAAGAQQWVSRYNGPVWSDDRAQAIAVDAGSNVYVTGYSLGSGTGTDYATVKYSASGAQQWVSRYNGPANANELAWAMAIDGVGNVYVTGSSFGSATGWDYATVKYGQLPNRAPVLQSIANREINTETQLSFKIEAQDLDAGQSLTYALVAPNPLPGGVSLNAATGAFTWTPTAAQSGTYVFTVRVTDNGSPALSDEKSFTVTVSDVTAPVVVTRNVTVGLDEQGTVTVEAGQVNNNSSDDSGIKSLHLSKTHFTCTDIGDNSVTLTVTDHNGNTASAPATVTVKDVLPPVAIAKDVILQLDADGKATLLPAQLNNGSRDACDGSDLLLALDQTTFGCAEAGKTVPVTLTVTDKSGNAAKATANVTVGDSQKPTITGLPTGDITVYTGAAAASCQAVASWTTPVTSDNCAAPTLTVTHEPGASFPVGTTKVTYTAKDAAGNQTSASFNIIVVDNAKPVPQLAALPDVTGECSAKINSFPTASDNCKGVITAITTDMLEYSQQGTYTVTWTYNDGNGNSTTQTQKVVVIDAKPPVPAVTSLPDVAGECVVTVPAPTASDNCKGVITATTTSPTTFITQGTYTITWTYSDGNGNAIQQQQKVVVKDVTDPLITAPASLTLSNDPGQSGRALVNTTLGTPVVSDNCAGVKPATNNAPTTFPLGATTVTWTVEDAAGNQATATQLVTILNTTPADLVLGSISAPLSPVQINTTVAAGATYTAGTLQSAVWNWGNGTTSGIIDPVNRRVTGSRSYSTPGVYTVSLTVTDAGGKTATSVFQYVVVYDPSGGFVTGGGWINSTINAYAPNPSATGRANFGFVSKYHKGATVPTGNTNFQFTAVGMEFNSTAYEWLVVSGSKAQYKGWGTLNGQPGYRFILTANDGGVNGGGGVDRFRIKIWKDGQTDPVYDNQRGAADDATATTAIGAGSIVVHDGKNKARESTQARTEAPLAGARLHSFPNPFTGQTTLEFALGRDEAYTLEIYDLKGRLVSSLGAGSARAGKLNQIVWQAGKAPSGMYFASLTTKAGVQHLKLILR